MTRSDSAAAPTRPTNLSTVAVLSSIAGASAFLALLRPFGALAMTPACVHLAVGGVVLLQTHGRVWEGAIIGAAASMAGGMFFYLADPRLGYQNGFIIVATAGTLGLWVGAAFQALFLRFIRTALVSLLALAVWIAAAAQVGFVSF